MSGGCVVQRAPWFCHPLPARIAVMGRALGGRRVWERGLGVLWGLPCSSHVLPGWQHWKAGSGKLLAGSESSLPAAADPRAVRRLSADERLNEHITSARQAESGRRLLSCLIPRRAGHWDRRMLLLGLWRALRGAEGCLCHHAHLAGMSRVSICIKSLQDPQMRALRSAERC